MTIEAKAKAYDEALERARELLNSPRTCFDIDQLKDIFQQLRESEDERIRKRIKLCLAECVHKDIIRDYEHDEALAWLEKQKEQKPAEKISVSEELYEHIRNACACIDDAMSSDTLCDMTDYLEMADSSAQKAFDMVERSVVKQPAEWSEEDETRLTNILIMLKEYVIHHYSKDDVNKSVDWLENRFKSLRPQPREEIYQAARHDLAIKFMNYLDENRPEGKMSLSNTECEDIDKAFKGNDWEKIIRYANKYSWKPSEEQI